MSFDNIFDSTCESRVVIDKQRDSITSANEELVTTMKQRRCSRGNDYYALFVKCVQSHGGKCLFSKQCISSKKKGFTVMCAKGHEFSITLTTLLKNRFCPQCHKIEKSTFREYSRMMKQKKELYEMVKQEQYFQQARMKFLQEMKDTKDYYSIDSTDLSSDSTESSICTLSYYTPNYTINA